MAANLNTASQFSTLSPAKRALLELKLSRAKASGRRTSTIERKANRTSAPLSYNQHGLWLLDRLLNGSAVYHTPTAARLRGRLDVEALQKAFDAIVARHDTLRTTFVLRDAEPVQVIGADLSLPLALIDLTRISPDDREEEALRRMKEEARRTFDLANGPLVRAALFRLAEDDHILLVTMHHIVTDGWSVGVFQHELSSLYDAFVQDQPSSLPDLPIQYGDFAEWQRERASDSAYQSQLAYWKQQFSPLPPPLELPLDKPRTSTCAFRGQHHKIALTREATAGLKQLCQKENITLFMALFTAYTILLHRYTAQEDIVVGTPIAGRSLPETEPLIGMFINTLPLRTNVSDNPSCRELFARIKKVSLDAYANPDVPFEQVVKEVRPERSAGQNPLVQAMFVLQDGDGSPLKLTGLEVEQLRVGNTMANFDLTLDVREIDGRLVCLFESNADLFEPATVQRLTMHFQKLVEALVNNPDRRVSDLPMLSDEERHQLLVEWNNTETDYPKDKTLSELFEQQVARSPDAIALAGAGFTLTFAELNARANQLAHYLRSRGVKEETPVGICLDRSAELIVAILGTLKAGAFYVPLDPCYPETRLEFMLNDGGVQTLLTSSDLAGLFSDRELDCICLDQQPEIWRCDGNKPHVAIKPDSLAYVMYTSGSTGTPKGVCTTHRNIVRLVKNTNYASFSATEVFLLFAPVTFDASAFEIFGSLLNGARLAIMPPGKASLNELGAVIREHKVTTLWLTAGLFHLMVENHLEDLSGLRQLLAGGDVLSVPHVRKVLATLKDCRLINGYGPTENTTFTTTYEVTDAPDNSSIPIGRPLANTTTYILDRYRNPVPIGVTGELYTGGDGLARGYLNRPDLTAERFVANPFSASPGARLYKTGDLVRYRRNGEIEFLGRIDNQVKVRGFRIEPGEVEQTLAEHPSVQLAAVVARKDQADKHLVAYFVGDGVVDEEELRAFVKQRLPHYMVPSFFVQLESLPLSSSGKVDRRALPANGFKTTPARAIAEPVSDLERKLAAMWEKVLGVSNVGVHDNFFELGGHSLLAVRLFAEIEKAFGKNLPLATLFDAPSVRQLARIISDADTPTIWSSLVTLQSEGDGLPLFCIHASGGNVLEYHDLVRHLGKGRAIYGLQAKGLDGKSEPHTTIPNMAAHYLREIRAVQPRGPYLLAGRSSGGTIAFEMAQQLKQEGEQVALLALFDTYPAGYFKLLKESQGFAGSSRRLIKRLRSHLRNLRRLTFFGKTAYIFNKLSYVPEKVKHKSYRRAYKLYQRIGRPLPALLQNIEELNFSAVKDYTPQVYWGDVTLFLASDLTADYDLVDGWRELVKGHIEVHEISGDHINIIKEPHVAHLAIELNGCLDRAQAKQPARRDCAA